MPQLLPESDQQHHGKLLMYDVIFLTIGLNIRYFSHIGHMRQLRLEWVKGRFLGAC